MLMSRVEGYLAKAKEADAQAQKVLDPQAKKAWIKVAESYRQLAKALALEK
jgi:hypothetical protein